MKVLNTWLILYNGTLTEIYEVENNIFYVKAGWELRLIGGVSAEILIYKKWVLKRADIDR